MGNGKDTGDATGLVDAFNVKDQELIMLKDTTRYQSSSPTVVFGKFRVSLNRTTQHLSLKR